MDEYQRDGSLVKGTDSIVYRAFNRTTESHYVIKEFSPAGVNAGLREISSLQQLGNHSRFIIKLEHHQYFPNADRPLKVVYELLPSHLRHYIATHPNRPPETIRSVMYQLLLGLEFIHGNGIMHRNLRSELILLPEDGQELRVKISDFRCSKSRGVTQHGAEGLTPPSQIPRKYVVNRAPELLLGAAEYKFAVDIWSTGCIFAEITCGHKLFRGHVPGALNEDTAQLLTIFSVLGTPGLSERDILGVDDMIDMNKEPHYARATLADLMELVPGLTLQGADLLNVSTLDSCSKPLRTFKHRSLTSLFISVPKMLQYIPEARSTASVLLEHEFFRGLARNQFQ